MHGLALLAALALAGCSTNGAVFFTKTSVSVAEVDSTPPEVNIGFHRIEGAILPRNDDGNVPSVLAHMQSNREILAPELKHVYATGDAALNLVRDPADGGSPGQAAQDKKGAQSNAAAARKNLEQAAGAGSGAQGDGAAPAGTPSDRNPVLFFATSTAAGIRLGLTAGGVDGLTLFGFRRKELSVVPDLVKDGQGRFQYPSLLATQRLNAKPSAETGFACQGFFTGEAAEALANSIRSGGGDSNLGCDGVSVRADLLGAYYGSKERQRAEIAEVMNCYVRVPQAARPESWKDAQRHGLFADPQSGKQETLIAESEKRMKVLSEAYQKANALADAAQKTKELQVVDGLYAGTLLNYTGGEKQDDALTGSRLREQLLRSHREFVCDQAKKG